MIGYEIMAYVFTLLVGIVIGALGSQRLTVNVVEKAINNLIDFGNDDEEEEEDEESVWQNGDADGDDDNEEDED